jgi:hypothetical protein
MAELRASRKCVRQESDNQFSLLLSTMPGTKWLNSRNQVVELPVGSFVIWRGDYIHAGAAYNIFNSRLFVSLGSFLFPPVNTVTIVH